jgi:uncharacterized protein (DUF2235 family)
VIYAEYKKRLDTKEQRKKFDDWMENRKNIFHHHTEVIIHIMGLFDTVGSLATSHGMFTSALDELRLNPYWNDS